MRKSQSASISPSEGGKGNRLGVRTRKKHKRLDAICEDVYNRNRGVELESNEGEGTSRGKLVQNESELRRSSRARRAPVVLDSSPPPARKRRKLDKLGGNIHGDSVKKLKGKVKLKDDAPLSSSANSEEELRAWKLRLRSRRTSGNLGLIGSRNQPRGKRKLVWDDVEEMRSLKDEPEDEMQSSDRDNLRVLNSVVPDSVRTSNDGKDELHDDNVVDGNLESGAHTSGDEGEDDGDTTPSTSGRIGNEENADGSPSHFSGNKTEQLNDIQSEEKVDMIDDMEENEQNDDMEENEQNHEPLDSSKLVKDAEDQRQVGEATTPPSGLAKNVGHDVMKEDVAEDKEKHEAVENGAKLGHCNVFAGGTPRSSVKRGRRCGLCGGGIDGKPPKIMTNDSAGSDNDAYSGSSASEECNYDPWDGFGDEPGWLGKLLGPINDRYGIAGIWVHQHCAVWSPEVYFAGLGCLKNIRAALCRGRALKCTRCGRPGATLGCRVDRCPRTYHLPCARASGCIFDHRKFLIACADHRYLFQPHGLQYAQRIKKLKAKKMKMEIRKLSNDASRKDLEAEEKWLEKCGEDEEFLRRETKRLQRDLLRIAPVYIGGPHSGDENPFEGWDSVAGLQDVIQCMKEVVILPLLYPEFYENMGITPPRGVLLHGYPGTGKTLVVKALIGSCARGDKRIAYFARKGADCLGKYVGDAERQLRLLFQVAEKSQPSIIFFDEIDGLAPVRTRQQDQTHSSVVSTLLALMDGLKSRGSVIVIGATNRPDSVDPALRRPGRFDREIYFPLPSMKDRAAILALHTRKWPKPVSGTLLEWVADRTVGFAGADLQALCAQTAVIALKRNCCWQQILSYAGDHSEQGRLPKLPSFSVEERDWLEALSLAPPPCSRREAGMAANEVLGFPLHIHLIPFLLRSLLSLIVSLYLDDRLWLPRRLVSAGASMKMVVVSFMEKKGLHSDNWWCHAQDMVQDPDATKEIVRNLSIAGILHGDASTTGYHLSNDTPCGDGGFHSFDLDFSSSGALRNLCYAPSKKTGYRILISGDSRSGQKHLAACLLHCFVGSIELQKIDLAIISQEGHGDMEQGISQILMKCSRLKLCLLFMPRLDLWAIESCPSVQEDVEVSKCRQSFQESLSTSYNIGREKCSSSQSRSDLMELTGYQDEISSASQIWRSFVEQLECLSVSSSLIILATSELPSSALPRELCQFFGSELLTPEGSVVSDYGTPRFPVKVEGEFDCDKLIHLSSWNLSRDLIQQFVQLVHVGNHCNSDSRIPDKACHGSNSDTGDLKLVEEPMAKQEVAECSVAKSPVPSISRNVKGKSSLILAINAFGYQILRYPHFSELCWVTSKLKEGPSTNISGPWKGWPFNSCVVRPCKSMTKETVVGTTNNSKGKDQFTLVRGLIAVGLSAYRGIYASATEVSLEVRKVLELLVGQIASKIQAGKDRYQYIRLLSQVAYLEDMVNNWSHSLRSLEPDPQLLIVNSKQSSETLPPAAANHILVGDEPTEEPGPANQGLSSGSPPSANPMQLDEEPNIQVSGFDQREHECQPTDSHMKTIDVVTDNSLEAVNLDEGSPQKSVATNHILPRTYSAGKFANQDKGPPKEVDLGSNAVSDMTDLVDSISDQSCSKISEVSTQEPSQFFPKSFGQPTTGTSISAKLENSVPHVSHELCNQSVPELSVENDISPSTGNCTSDLHPRDSRKSERNVISSDPAVICSYRFCIGCVYNLHQLVKKIVAQQWKSSSSCCTMEDVHDFVSTLSSSLCSTIRNLYSEACSGSEDGGLKSKKPESRDLNTCQCRSSDNKLANLKECVCHSGQDFLKSTDPSSGNKPTSNLTFIFRDGVLVSANLDKESPFHCKYETLCLCSLLDLILGMKQPLD